eukprot:Rmarinus@m.21391
MMISNSSLDNVSMETVSLSDDQSDLGFLSEQQKRTSDFIRKHFSMKICRTFVPSEDHPDECLGCQRPARGHTGSKGLGEKWRSHTDTREEPTNSFGEILFPGGGATGKGVPYVRVSDETDPRLLVELCANHWLLPTPGLLISVTGPLHDFDIADDLRQQLLTTLIRTASTTQAWIVTGGSDAGVPKFIGEARAQFGDHVPVVGVSSWGIVASRDHLVSKERLYGTRLYHAGSGDTRATSINLDPFHSHFVLVDDGSLGVLGKELVLRSRFEAAISKSPLITPDIHVVPRVCVMVNGGPGSLVVTTEAVRQGTPVVALVQSGGFAEWIATTWRHMHRIQHRGHVDAELPRRCDACAAIRSCATCMAIVRGEPGTKWKDFPCSSHLICGIVSRLGEKTLGAQQTSTLVRRVMYIAAHRQQIAVFDMDAPDADLDTCILRTILHGGNHSFTEQLELSIRWNRPDITRSEILTPSNIRSHRLLRGEYRRSLRSALVAALLQNSPVFTKILLDSGAEIQLSEDLPKLYSSADGCVESLYFDFGRRELLRRLCRAAVPRHALRTTRPFGEGIDPPGTSMRSEPGTLRELPPGFYLLMWAILSYRYELAVLFLDRSSNVFSDAVCAACLCRTLSAYVPKQRFADARHWADHFENVAVEFVSYCQELGYEESVKLFLQPLPFFHTHRVLLDLVFAGRCHVLMKTDQFLDAIIRRWCGPVPFEEPLAKVALGALFFPLIPLISSETSNSHPARFIPDEPAADAVSDLRDPERSLSEDGLPEPADLTLPDPAPTAPTHARSLFFDWLAEIKGVMVAKIRRYRLTYEGVMRYYHTPGVKFVVHAAMHICFCILFSAVTLSSFPPTIQVQEYFLMLWVLALVVEEAHQMMDDTFSKWWSSGWNRLDALLYTGYIVSLVFRVADYQLDVDSSAPPTKQIMAVGVVVCSARVLSVFSMHPKIGPLLVTCGKMVTDVMTFLLIFVVILLGFGVAFHSLTDPWNQDKNTIDIISNILEQPYWTAYGDLGILSSDSSGLFTWMVAMYLIIANIVLVNLLIAMMGSTYSAVADSSHFVWVRSFYETVEEYSLLPAVPPPLSLFSRCLDGLRVFRKRQGGLKKDKLRWTSTKMLRKGVDREFLTFVETVGRNFVKQQQNARREKANAEGMGTYEEVKRLTTRLGKLERLVARSMGQERDL